MASKRLTEAVVVTAELTGARFSEPALTALFAHLERFPEASVLDALSRCQMELRYPLTLAAILDRIDDGHPGAEEAWAVVAGKDEDDTVVWTDEIAISWERIRDLLDDRVAARMAFLEIYRGVVANAKARDSGPRWRASLGWDKSKRASALLEAVDRGRLSVPAVKAMLPPTEWPESWTPKILPGNELVKVQANALVEDLRRKMIRSPDRPERTRR